MADLKPKSFFFTGLPSSTQSPNQAFGPVVGNETTQFRTTSKFTATANAPAYAICTGQVFIQPGATAGTINLILRPYRQPIKGLAIKYFIYRGLNSSDFLSSSTNLIGHQDLDAASQFINIVWSQLKTFNDWDNTQADSENFLAKWIGYDPSNQPLDGLIDDYFFMANLNDDGNDEELKPFEFPIIKEGTHLGSFIGEYGLDIVLSDGDYKPLSPDTGFQYDLAYARASEGVIDTQNLPANTSEKQYRESVFNFMDPAAYYGLHYNGGKVSVVNGTNEPVLIEGQAIYDNILVNFATKNNIYIYLQNHLGRSYNYYSNYTDISADGDVLKIGITEDNIQVALPTTEGWPLLILNDTQNHSEDSNSIYIQFAVGNQTPLCFAQLGKINDAAENNFLVYDQLLPIQPEPVEGQPNDINVFSQPVSVTVPAISGTGSAKLNVASYAKLLYLGASLIATEIVDSEPVVRTVKALDTLFSPIHIESRFASAYQSEISWCVSYKNNLIDTSLITKNNTSKIAAQTKVIFDKLAYTENDELLVQDRVIYETQLIEGIGKGLFERSNSNTGSENAGCVPFDEENNNFYRVAKPYYLETEIFSDKGRIITGVRLRNYNVGSELGKYSLGLATSENNQIVNIIEVNNLKNVSLFLGNKYEADRYKSYDLLVYGEEGGELKIYELIEPVKVFTLDDMLYYSDRFSMHMHFYDFKDEIIPDFNL